jgi:hypothetical protein
LQGEESKQKQTEQGKGLCLSSVPLTCWLELQEAQIDTRY